MKLDDVLRTLLASPNVASRAPIYETYDKNVQGNTAHERGRVAASIAVPFRDFPELSESGSKTGVAIANGGNPNLAKISAKTAAEHAIVEAVVKVSCVGGTPLAATDCLNFGNPEKADQMGDFVAGVEGLKVACEALNVPIVSGNVSLYNEASGTSIPPSAMVSVFARVDDPAQVPQLSFPAYDPEKEHMILLIGARSDNLGGSEFLRVCEREDARTPQLDYDRLGGWLHRLQHLAAMNAVTSATPILRGGMLVAACRAAFDHAGGVELALPSDVTMPQVLFAEDPGVLVSTAHPERIEEIFGDDVMVVGRVLADDVIRVRHGDNVLLEQDLSALRTLWAEGLRVIF